MSCSPARNYNDSDGPFYKGNFAEDDSTSNGSLRIVTWNIRHGENIEAAIKTLQESQELRNADIIMLQEMDELGTEEVARALSYNYIFYPTIYRLQDGKIQGNATLSKWPIVSHSKISLPKFITDLMQTRIAVHALIDVNGTEINTYNAHLETVWMLLPGRTTQASFLSGEISTEVPAIVGGDFNTWNDFSIASLDKKFNNIGLVRISKGSGYTFETSGFRLVLDHLFASDVDDFNSGVYRETDASDHYPLWADIKMKQIIEE